MKTARIIIAASIAVASSAAHAAQAPRLELQLNLASYHTKAWARRELNQTNPGLGLEYRYSPSIRFAGGFYLNSYRRESVYALGEWMPLHVRLPLGLSARAGVAGGVITGYRRSEVPCAPLAAGVVATIRTRSGWGVNLVGVPNTTSGSGFVGLQLTLPFSV